MVTIGKKLTHFLMEEPFKNYIIDSNITLIKSFKKEDGHWPKTWNWSF